MIENKVNSPLIASRITLYILAKELNISPAEAYSMPYSMIRDFMILFSIQKEEEVKEMEKMKNGLQSNRTRTGTY